MKVIDCWAHFEPRPLSVGAIIERMDLPGIDQALLMSVMTRQSIYRKSNALMGIQRQLLNSRFLWFLAKRLDDGFYRSPGEWDPWYRKLTSKGNSYEIVPRPNDETVFETVERIQID